MSDARQAKTTLSVARASPPVLGRFELRLVGDGGEGCRTLRAVGAEWEMVPPYAGLHQLCVELPGRSRSAAGAAA